MGSILNEYSNSDQIISITIILTEGPTINIVIFTEDIFVLSFVNSFTASAIG